MAICEILQEIMVERDISVADVARMCNLPDSTVRGIIRRKQDTTALEVAFKLSDGLGVSLERLNGMQEKSPDATEAEPRDRANEIYNYINDGLVALGLIGEDEDITEQQTDILISVARIIDAAFDKS